VLLQPLTGRRHQLRVHCREWGHPIVGDCTYPHRPSALTLAPTAAAAAAAEGSHTHRVGFHRTRRGGPIASFPPALQRGPRVAPWQLPQGVAGPPRGGARAQDDPHIPRMMLHAWRLRLPLPIPGALPDATGGLPPPPMAYIGDRAAGRTGARFFPGIGLTTLDGFGWDGVAVRRQEGDYPANTPW